MLQQLETIAHEAGAVMLGADARCLGTEAKSNSKDLVTRYDKAVQELVFRRMREAFPGIRCVGEETGLASLEGGPFCLVDPIDGTANFVCGLEHSCVSIAYGEAGEVSAGCVYDPYLDECFCAEKGAGAQLNGAPLAQLADRPLAEVMAVMGTAPYDLDLADDTFTWMRVLFDRCLDIRRTGSAALDLCWVAAGRFGIYCEARLSPWDHAAAGLVAREAGATVSQVDGQPLSLAGRTSVLAGNPAAVREFQRALG